MEGWSGCSIAFQISDKACPSLQLPRSKTLFAVVPSRPRLHMARIFSPAEDFGWISESCGVDRRWIGSSRLGPPIPKPVECESHQVQLSVALPNLKGRQSFHDWRPTRTFLGTPHARKARTIAHFSQHNSDRGDRIGRISKIPWTKN